MKKLRWAAMLSAAIVAAALVGCGSSGGSDSAGNSGNPASLPESLAVSPVVFTASASGDGAVSHSLVDADGSVFMDASAEATGAGAGSGPLSVYDSALSKCTYSFNATSSGGDIQVVSDSSTCSSPNKCIVCTAAGSGTSSCSISCVGVVPSNTTTALQTFNISLAFDSIVKTDMASPPDGTIRYDAKKGSAYAEMNLGSPTEVLTGCNNSNPGTDHEMALTLADNSASTTNVLHKIFTISAVDQDSGSSPANLSTCVRKFTYTAAMPLAGADTPGATVSMTRGTIYFNSKICDYASGCTTPAGY